MKKQIFCVIGILTLAISGSARASLVSVDIIAGPANPDGIHNTWRVVARFSDAGDQISSVNSVAKPIHFFTGSGNPMYNQSPFDGSTLNDFPSVGIGGEAWDSYVTVGASTFPSNIQFSPNFLGDWDDAPPPVQVILGTEFYEDDGAWFFFGAPPNVSDLEDSEADNETFDILVFQVGVDSGGFHLSGSIQWFNPVSGDNNTIFIVDIPTPGVLALFSIAGLVGVRRRRD